MIDKFIKKVDRLIGNDKRLQPLDIIRIRLKHFVGKLYVGASNRVINTGNLIYMCSL